MKRYRFGFDPWGLGLFALIMLPNIAWMLLAGEDDLLLRPSVTPTLDGLVAICQALMAAGMVFLQRRDVPAARSFWPLPGVAAYWLMWALYGLAATHPTVLIGLAVFPCAAILTFLARKRNWLAAIPAAVFSAGHLLSVLINFVF